MKNQVMKMQRVKNATKYLVGVFLIFLIDSCASQAQSKIISKDFEKLSYDLIKNHYSNGKYKVKRVNLYYKTTNQDSTIFINEKKGIVGYLKIYHRFWGGNGCKIDSIIPKAAQQKLDNAYNSFKVVELDEKALKSNAIFLVYPETKLRKMHLKEYITFPQIFINKGAIYGVFVSINKISSDLYFYKLENNKWQLLCDPILTIS